MKDLRKILSELYRNQANADHVPEDEAEEIALGPLADYDNLTSEDYAADPHDNTAHETAYAPSGHGNEEHSTTFAGAPHGNGVHDPDFVQGSYEVQKNGTDGTGIINFKT